MRHRQAEVGSAPARTTHRPQLLILVYGVFLVLIGLTASGLVATTSADVEQTSLRAAVSEDRAMLAWSLRPSLQTDDLSGLPLTDARARELESQLAELLAPQGILRVALIANDGRIVVADQPALRDTQAPSSPALDDALAGDPRAGLRSADQTGQIPGPAISPTSYVEEYLPLLFDGQQVGVVGIWRDAGAVLADVARVRTEILFITLAAAAVLGVILFLLFRAAQQRLLRQQEQLLATTQHDPLTGLLNHGAIVALLVNEVESSSRRDDRIGVALIDLDNFRNLNDTHSHAAGDEVLLTVAELLPEGSRTTDHVARYGPDEFLVVRGGADAEEMGRIVDEIHERLADVHVQFADSEHLPVTVSAGIAVLPDDAQSVTELLAQAAAALAEAKAGGGNAVRFARPVDAQAAASPLSVLQGLVIAVDNKDRYTRRHSEDVARYAVFLGRRLGLDQQALDSLHLSGLLHDVGKIAIPDTVLRKPGRLTGTEYEIFKQHVALGDTIVRDLPNITAVRSGIRTHHERWDGNGYLGGLEGEEIPLIGRILAVADAFSAMTTSRPYRKALPVEEALKRLGDAAGSQLEEPLVKAFIEGIETDVEAPLPGEASGVIWLPELRVA